MDTPNTYAGRLTERIMFAILEHIKPVEPGVMHYNRAYEKVLAILSEPADAKGTRT